MYPQVYGSESLHGPYERFLEQGIGALAHASSWCMQWLKKNETLPRELHTDIPTTWYFKIPFRSLSQCERQLWLRLLLERQKNILERQVSNPFICSGTIWANSKWGLSPDVCKIFACCSYLDALSDVFCSSLAVIIVSLRVLQWRRRVTQSYRCALTGDVIGAIPMPRVHIVTEAQPL